MAYEYNNRPYLTCISSSIESLLFVPHLEHLILLIPDAAYHHARMFVFMFLHLPGPPKNKDAYLTTIISLNKTLSCSQTLKFHSLSTANNYNNAGHVSRTPGAAGQYTPRCRDRHERSWRRDGGYKASGERRRRWRGVHGLLSPVDRGPLVAHPVEFGRSLFCWHFLSRLSHFCVRQRVSGKISLCFVGEGREGGIGCW